MRRRRGYSLVELLIVIAVSTAMLMVAMSVLYMLKETQDNVRQRLTSGRMTTRLADQFREDVHMASRIERLPSDEAPSQNALWQLAVPPDTTVQYEIGDGRVRRVQARNDERIQEDFRLPPGINAELVPPKGRSTMAVLRFEKIDAESVGARPVQAETILGFTNRHSPSNGQTTE